MDPVKDASYLYEVERRALHAERPGFRISELQISPTQTVPWHFHNNVQDTFYVIAGRIRIFLREPTENLALDPGEVFSVGQDARTSSKTRGILPPPSLSSREAASTTTSHSPN